MIKFSIFRGDIQCLQSPKNVLFYYYFLNIILGSQIIENNFRGSIMVGMSEI